MRSIPVSPRIAVAANDRALARAVPAIVPWLPRIGVLIAAALIFSRRPDALTHAQFWAEDGSVFFANVYNHGLLASLAAPQVGYFPTLEILSAGLEQLVPLGLAPLLGNIVAIAIRVLPVGLLLHPRAARIAPSVWVRALLAGLYIGLPGVAEANANVDSALWYLAVSAVIVLMLAPPVHRLGRAFDGAVLGLCAVSGVFSIVLAPLAFVYRRRRRDLPAWTVGILAAGAGLQVLAIVVLQFHLPSAFAPIRGVSMPLRASPLLLLQILGHRVLLAPVVGDEVQLSGVGVAYAGALCLTFGVYAFRRGSAEMRLLLAFCAGMLVLALARPRGTDWPGLASSFNSGRYFIMPQLGLVACLVWGCGRARERTVRVTAVLALAFACLVTIPTHWSYRSFADTGFASQAAVFEHASAGTRTTFAVNPLPPFTVMPWRMVLIKH